MRSTDVQDEQVEPQAEMQRMPGHLIRRMHQASQAIFDTQMAKAGFDLTSVQFAALTVISARPGLDQATLASAIAFDRATTGGVVDRLEAKGLVRREIAKGDRRSRRLYPEPAAKAVLEGATPIVRALQDLILGGLSEIEREAFLRLLFKALSAAGEASRLQAKSSTSPKTMAAR